MNLNKTLLRSTVWLLLGLAALAPLFGPLRAQESGARPEINRPYVDPDYETWVSRFERPGREVYDKRHEIVAALGLNPGMAVADIGAGTGLFTRLFAAKVAPTGTVYAVDVSRIFIDNILRTSKERGLSNVKGIVNTQTDVKLPVDSIDFAFVCDTYHHFEQPAPTLQSIHRALQTGGIMVIIDFRKIAGVSSSWVMGHVRADKGTVIREVEAAGFRLIEDKDLLRDNYFLRFKKS